MTYPGYPEMEEQEIVEAIRTAYRHDHNIVTLFTIIDRLRAASPAPPPAYQAAPTQGEG
jgi:hypothetical protein